MDLTQKSWHFAQQNFSSPKAQKARFLAPRTPLGVQRDVLETRKPAGVSGAEYGTNPGHGRNILRILKTCQSLGSLKATSKGNHGSTSQI